MKPSSGFFHQITAHIAGRNIIIVSGLTFCAFVIYLFMKAQWLNPLVALVFAGFLCVVAIAIIFIGLLKPPLPSEVTSKLVLQRDGDHTLMASGLQSMEELTEFLRHAHNIRPLPPPSGIVVGSATNPAHYRDITPAEAQALAQQDIEGVNRNLLQEAERIQNALLPAGGALKRDSLSAAADASRMLDTPGTPDKRAS